MAAVSFTAWMQQFKAFVDTTPDSDRYMHRWSDGAPALFYQDYTDFVHGAAILRGLCREGKLRDRGYPLTMVLTHAKAELDRAIAAEDWDAARAWLRPGIAHEPKTYHACEREHPAELGATARQGRADGMRQWFWCRLVKDVLPWFSLPSHPQGMHEHITFLALFELDELSRKLPLERTALDDDRFGDGTVYEVWLKDLSPHLLHRRPEFERFEDELRARSPLPFDARLALAQGLHSRLGASSDVMRLTSEIAQMVVNSDTARRTPLRLLPPS